MIKKKQTAVETKSASILEQAPGSSLAERLCWVIGEYYTLISTTKQCSLLPFLIYSILFIYPFFANTSLGGTKGKRLSAQHYTNKQISHLSTKTFRNHTREG